MKNIVFRDSLDGIDADVLILRHNSLQENINQQLNGAVDFNLNLFSYPVTMTSNGACSVPKLIFVNGTENLASLANEKTVAIAIDQVPAEQLAFEILMDDAKAENVIFICDDPKQSEQSFQKYRDIFESVTLAKEIIASPANLMPPAEIARRCQQLENLTVTVFDEDQLRDHGAHALLAVGKGSPNTPKMVIMEYRGSDEPPIALVGKGICYDAGGINLKNSYLVEMKWDKAGAGAVIGVMDALSKLKLPINVVGVIVLAENMPDGNALKPGDVISSMSGKSIEVIDTDCEGRLALVDGIAYVQKYFSPKTLIDLGTLTLETFGALGAEYAGLFSPDPELSQALIEAGEAVGEKLWPLPLGDYYAQQIRSQNADLKNVGVFRYGGSSAAAEFIRAFVDPKISWAHLDIAGTAWKLDRPEDGVTAFGVRLIMEYLFSYNSK